VDLVIESNTEGEEKYAEECKNKKQVKLALIILTIVNNPIHFAEGNVYKF